MNRNHNRETEMQTAYTHPSAGDPGILKRSEMWMDARGKYAWIAAIVLGFIFMWPLGLALLGYVIWRKKMHNKSCCGGRHSHRHMGFSGSGNSAFDSYKADTLRRLEEEQAAFEAFMQRLREAKDKSEFDDFMDSRARAATAPAPSAPEAGQTGAY